MVGTLPATPAPARFASPAFALPPGASIRLHTRSLTGKAAHCHYCGRMTFPGSARQQANEPRAIRTADHVYPSAHGGGNDKLVVACAGCNGLKGDTPYEVFCAWLRLPGADSWHNRAELSYRRFVFDCARAGLEAARQLARWTREEAETATERERHRAAVAAAYEQFRGSRMRAAA